MNKIMPDTNDPKNVGRRDFFRKSWKILGLAAAAELGFLTFNLLSPGKEKRNNTESSSLKIAGNIGDFQKNSVTADRVNKYFLIRESDGGFLALSLICPHLGCSVNWEESKGKFICPCHSSSFDQLGNVINSPAPRALDYYPIIIEEGKVKIDMSQRLKRKRFEKNQVTYAD